MKRHPSIIPYSQEHQKVLLLAQVLKSDVTDYRGMPTTIEGKIEMALDYYERIIHPHEQREEDSLFPDFLNRDPEIDRLVEELIQEHRTIGQLMARLKESSFEIQFFYVARHNKAYYSKHRNDKKPLVFLCLLQSHPVILSEEIL